MYSAILYQHFELISTTGSGKNYNFVSHAGGVADPGFSSIIGYFTPKGGLGKMLKDTVCFTYQYSPGEIQIFFFDSHSNHTGIGSGHWRIA